MKKIDLHIHTVKTDSDSPFNFSMDTLKRYVTEVKLDAIAITNHNLFDRVQFEQIKSELAIPVFPGIEIDVAKGHLLLISDGSDLDDFESRCNQVHTANPTKDDDISVTQLKSIFTDLNSYLLIPHYDKGPQLSPLAIHDIGDEYIFAGEVGNPGKFTKMAKSNDPLVPVLFSDMRMSSTLTEFNARQTYIDIGNAITLSLIKYALHDKMKVSLTAEGGHQLIQIFSNGQKISSGLNVMLGARSTGKSYTLKRLVKEYGEGKVKYVKQFGLLYKDEDEERKRFDEELSKTRGGLFDTFISEFKQAVDDIAYLRSRAEDDRTVEEYLSTLKQFASEEGKRDSFSRCNLYNDSLFILPDGSNLEKLISAVETLLDNKEYEDLINSHVDRQGLITLYGELISKLRRLMEARLKKKWVNDLVETIKQGLQMNTASTVVSNIDLSQLYINRQKRAKFVDLCRLVKRPRKIESKTIGRFTVVAEVKTYDNATDMKNIDHRQVSLVSAYNHYDDPLSFLEELDLKSEIMKTSYYKYFVKIDYRVLNEDNLTVSGGQLAEYNLLQKIQDAKNYDMLLVDEPESSFDNLFLKKEVIGLLKDMAASMPVIVVTHNNTLGASIQPNYILYAAKTKENGEAKFKIYSGLPTDRELKTPEGEVIDNFTIMMDTLEAGDVAYKERSRNYESLKN